MGIFTKDIHSLDDLFVHHLKDIYYAENRIAKTLPTMIAKATNAQLKSGFEQHLAETKNQITRLEHVFKLHGTSIDSVTCKAIDGIIAEAEEVVAETADKEVLDAGLIAAGQAVEHYEITRYGSMIAWARRLGHTDIASVLQQNLDEEKATDVKLTALAESNVNKAAA